MILEFQVTFGDNIIVLQKCVFSSGDQRSVGASRVVIEFFCQLIVHGHDEGVGIEFVPHHSFQLQSCQVLGPTSASLFDQVEHSIATDSQIALESSVSIAEDNCAEDSIHD